MVASPALVAKKAEPSIAMEASLASPESLAFIEELLLAIESTGPSTTAPGSFASLLNPH